MSCLNRPRIPLDEECLRWTPLVPPPGVVIPEDAYAMMPITEHDPIVNENTPHIIDSLKKKRKRRWYKAYHGRKRKRRSLKVKDKDNSDNGDDSQAQGIDAEEDDSQSAQASQQSQDEDDSATEEETEEEIMRSIQKEKEMPSHEVNGHLDDIHLEDMSERHDNNTDEREESNHSFSEEVIDEQKVCDSDKSDKQSTDNNSETQSDLRTDDKSNNVENSSANSDNSSVQTNSEQQDKQNDNKPETEQLDSEDKQQLSEDKPKETAIPKKHRWQRAVIDLNAESDEENEFINSNNNDSNKDKPQESVAKVLIDQVFN